MLFFVAMSQLEFKTPGNLLNHLLTERGWPQRVLAKVMGVSDSYVSKIVTGTKPVSAAVALQLEDALGVSADDFLALQRAADLREARAAHTARPRRQTQARLLADFPVQDMIDRGWLDVEDVTDLDAVEDVLVRFFEVQSVDDILDPAHAARKSDPGARLTGVQRSWLNRVRQITQEMVVPPYSEIEVRRVLRTLASLRAKADYVDQVPKLLKKCGIRYVVVQTLPGTKIDGVCFWLNDRSPVIGMTVRFDRVDNFWFVLRHELEHVIRRHGREVVSVDVELEGENGSPDAHVSEQERMANRAAAEFCVPRETLLKYVERKSPYFSERDILGLSRMVGAHPGLVVGQLQRLTGRYNFLRKHLVPVRSAVVGEAVFDGWGEIF